MQGAGLELVPLSSSCTDSCVQVILHPSLQVLVTTRHISRQPCHSFPRDIVSVSLVDAALNHIGPFSIAIT
jgi:hypothetical protein